MPLVFTVLCFLTGVMVFAYLTSAIVTLVIQADAAGVAFEHKKLRLLGFMRDASIDPAVVRRAHNWMTHWWHAQGGVQLRQAFDELPLALSDELRAHLFRSVTRHSLLFASPQHGARSRLRSCA